MYAAPSVSTLQDIAIICDGGIARLEARAAVAAARATEVTCTLTEAAQQCVPAFVSKASHRKRVFNKQLEMKEEEFGDSMKMLKCFLHQVSSVNELSLQVMEDTWSSLNRMLESTMGFSSVSTVRYVSGSDAVRLVGEVCHIIAEVDPQRSIVSHARWLARGECNTVTIMIVDSAGAAVYGVLPADVVVFWR